MTSTIMRRTGAYIAVCAVFAAGCAHRPTPKAPPSPPPLTPANTTPPERQHYVLELLAAGKRDQARVEAQQLLKEQPANTEAATLLNEIDADPQTLLGAQSFSYTIQPGESLVTLADRFLGDSNLFYALARYNNIDVPNDAAPGQAILIPSTKGAPAEHAPRPEHVEHGEHDRKEAAPVLRRREEPAVEAKKPVVEPPAGAAHDPARASALRSEALVEMNKGAIDHAVSLLRQASVLDPGSQAIAADLARALRIQGGAHK